MKQFNQNGLFFLPLGGAEEVGYNLYIYGADDRFIIVDVGYGFLNDDYPGMDMGMADMSFIDTISDKVEALFISHAHEDHFGAIAQLWPRVNCPVYATGFALGQVKNRLAEFKIKEQKRMIEVKDGDIIDVAGLQVQYAFMVHSTPQNAALLIKSKYGNVVHATDWKFDDGSLEDILPTNYDALEVFSRQGVDMLICDSTNILFEEETSYSELDVRNSLLEIIPQLENTVVATCFSTNIMRLQSLFLAAELAGRTPVIGGRSIINNVKIAEECGMFEGMPKYIEARDARDIPLDKILYICSGSQGNYRSGLYQIVNEENKHIVLGEGDSIVFSSQIIPGNEQRIERMQERLRARGVNVISKEEYLVHTSGHGGKRDVEKMYKILQPKILIPVHGEKRYLREHARFAKSLGIDQVMNINNGDIMLLNNGIIDKVDTIPTDIIGIDRNQLTSINSKLVQQRRRLMFNCSLFISVVFDNEWNLKDFQISSIDILEEDEWNKLAEEVTNKMIKEISEHINYIKFDHSKLIEFIKSKTRKQIEKQTGIKPVVFFHMYKG